MRTAFDDEDTFTLFAYSCHKLGKQIKTSSVAQAKDRIERLNETLSLDYQLNLDELVSRI